MLKNHTTESDPHYKKLNVFLFVFGQKLQVPREEALYAGLIVSCVAYHQRDAIQVCAV